MKNLKSKATVTTIFSVLIILILLSYSCSKQTEKKITENNQQQNNNLAQLDHQNTDTNKEEEPMGINDKMNIDKNNKNNIEHKMIKIPSAQCDICKATISKAIKKVKGVKSFEVDIDNHIIHINYDNTLTNLGKIEDAITKVGYDANNKKADPNAYAKLDDCCKKPEDRK